MKYAVGDRIGFVEERNRYKVWAASERFLVCTRFLFGTLLYTIVDFKLQVRGPENLLFSRGAESLQQCEEMLARLEAGESRVSRRHCLPLKIKEPKC